MVVMPTLAHRKKGYPPNVPALNSSVLNNVVHVTPVVREIPDYPVTEHRDRYSRAHPPEYKRPSAKPIKDCCNQSVVRHPSFFEEPIETILRDM
jgi:hypothetical protein